VRSGGHCHHPVADRCENLRTSSKPDSRTSAPYPDSDKTASPGDTVYWLILIISGVLEAVWATALGRTEGFTRLIPTIVFAVTLAASMAGLAYAMRGLPIGTAYAVWVGIGAALTAGYAMWAGQEPVSAIRVLLLAGIVGCVVGLKLTH
jgi:quaternary ammonium compound-resistance protein SugE